MLGFRLDAALEAAIERLSKTTNRSKSDIVRDALREYFDAKTQTLEVARQLAQRRHADAVYDWSFHEDLSDMSEPAPDHRSAA